MSIIDTKKAAFGPEFFRSVYRLKDIENDRDSVFVVSPNDALVSVDSIALDHSRFLIGVLGRELVRHGKVGRES